MAVVQKRPGESIPLLTGRLGTKKRKPKNRNGEPEDKDKYWEDWENESDPDLMADRKRRGTSLIVSDCLLLLIHTLQLYAMIQALSIRWVWPKLWLTHAKYAFFINGDVWEYVKFNSNVTFKAVKGYYTPSNAMPFPYWYILAGWAGVVAILLLIFILLYVCFRVRQHPFMLVYIAKLQRGYIIILQLLAIPLGLAMARVFHCTDKGVMDVMNETKCWQDHHWAHIAPVGVIFILYFVLFPAWLIMRTKNEMLNMSSDRHEGYLQLKEIEYVQGMDVMWIVNHFHIFSSFKKHGCHFRAVNHIMMGVFIILFAVFFNLGNLNNEFLQILLICLFILCLMIAYLIIRPFRVRAFNIMLFICLLLLLIDSLLGCLMTTFDAFSVQSIWLTPDYMVIILGLVNGFWIFCAVVFVLYLVLRHFFGLCRCCSTEPLWPSMTSRSLNKLTPETRTYVKSILRNRALAERTLSMPALFAPAHELSRQIHIINAYCREAEYLHDPMQDCLWDVLDELIDVHSMIAPRSLFADSVKDSIRRTAGEFMRLMPGFVRRLAQREYDLIMVRPIKRRLLLKLYCMGLFLNGRKEKVTRQRMNEPAIQKVWTHKKASDTEDDGYYEDMYPEPEAGPLYRPQSSSIIIDFLTGDELDDEVALQQAEQFTKDHPLSRQYTNLAFCMDDDLSTIMEDDVPTTAEVEGMMLDVPSRPNTMPFSDSQGGSHLSLRSATIDLPPESHTESRFSLRSSHLPTKDSMAPIPSSPLTERPGSGMSQRLGSSASQRPGSGASQRPGSGASQRPGSSASQRPGSGMLGPPPYEERATSAASLRHAASGSGSGSGSRPGSGRKSVTPLPGQIMDQEEPRESTA